jgi:hypothetical protein
VADYLRLRGLQVKAAESVGDQLAPPTRAAPEDKAHARAVEIIVECQPHTAKEQHVEPAARSPEMGRAFGVAAAHPGQAPKPFSVQDAIAYKLNPSTIWAHKDRFVHGMRDTIRAAATEYDLPPELIAGVAFNEYGGTDPIKFGVFEFRKTFQPGKADETSIPPMSLQVRRAEQSLGYDTGANEENRNEVVGALLNASTSVAIAAKHLSDLRDRQFPGRGANDLVNGPPVVIRGASYSPIEVMGARYNAGPDQAEQSLGPKALDYGKKIKMRWSHFTDLLKD